MGRPPIFGVAMTDTERKRRYRKNLKSRQSRFLKKARGLYETIEPRAVEERFTQFLPPGTPFIEPCAASGWLVRHLVVNGYPCDGASDIKPLPPADDVAPHLPASGIEQKDVFTYTSADVAPGTAFITNPNYDRKVLDPLIAHLSDIAPTWLLLYAGWLFAQESDPLRDRMRKVVRLGYRPRWFRRDVTDDKGKKKNGSERRDFAWVLFTEPSDAPTVWC